VLVLGFAQAKGGEWRGADGLLLVFAGRRMRV
jgi:hypothetical protein